MQGKNPEFYTYKSSMSGLPWKIDLGKDLKEFSKEELVECIDGIIDFMSAVTFELKERRPNAD